MLTGKKPPPLSLVELHQLRWSLGGLLALVSVWSVWYLEIDAWILLLVTTVAALAALVRPAIASLWPGWVHKMAFPVALAAVVFDLYTFGELLPAFVRLAIMLLLYRVCTYRKRRDDLQLILLGLFLIVTTGVLTVSIGFAVQIILFAALALSLLMTRTLVDAAETGRKPAGETGSARGAGLPSWVHVNWALLLRRLVAVSDWRVLGLGVILFSGLVTLSALLFLAIPRFQMDSSLFLDRWMSKRSLSGFSDTLRFGEVSDIQKDESIAMRVEVSDPREIPPELYWRMIVLDEYRDHTFRISQSALAGLSAEHNLTGFDWLGMTPHRFGSTQWKFYVEAGVSRYLPLMGEFSRLVFNETQVFRTHPELRLLVLSRDPLTMKAYRVDNMNTTGTMRETSRWNSPAADRKTQAEARTLSLGLPFTAPERQQWIRAAQEITGGKNLTAAEFMKAASLWLHVRHTYSLQSELPKSEGDPLTRWAFSTQPGHCELFAGSFTMLARAAGFPTRVIAGFCGGTWNGDYLIVRNSNAHAWCEIYDGEGNWLRTDPTAPPASSRTATAAEIIQGAGSHIRAETGWSARIDRLRMIWYRRIVNFERQDQMSLVKSLKERTDASGKMLREWVERTVKEAKRWVTKPWGLSRFLSTGLMISGGFAALWFWRSAGRDWWQRWRVVHRGAADPIRREAGRWLTRFAALPPDTAANGEERKTVEADLQRLRYGHRESWKSPEQTLRKAGRVFKKLRRAT